MSRFRKKAICVLLALLMLVGSVSCATATGKVSSVSPVADKPPVLSEEAYPVAEAVKKTTPEPTPEPMPTPAPVLTVDAALTVPEGKEDRIPYLTDLFASTRLTLTESESLTVTPVENASAIYCTFYDIPSAVTVETLSADGTVLSSKDRDIRSHLHLFPLDGATALRLTAKGGDASIGEVSACTDAFEPPFALEETKADLLVILPEPGDETKLLGGLLATYAGEKDIRCTVAYLAGRNGYAELEAINALRILGVQNQPVFLSLDDGDAVKSVHILKHMGGEKVLTDTVSALIGSVSPQVIIIPPETDGDELNNAVFGPVLSAAEKSNARVFIAGSGNTVISHTVPLSRYDGRTAKEVAEEAAKQYTWERVYRFVCPEETALTPVGTEEIVFSALFEGSAYMPAGTVPSFPSASETVQTGFQDASRFLDHGEPEQYTEDYDGGQWSYMSDTLSIQIERQTLPLTEKGNTRVVVYIADIYMRDCTSYRSGIRHDRAIPWKYARLEKAVLAITGDNYDVVEKNLKGCLIRNGRFYSNYAKQDTCAVSADGMSLNVLHPDAFTTESMLDSGVCHTYAFGPTLVLDGEVQFEACQAHRVNKINPRCGIGMVEPGHWVAICADGRQLGYSWGCDLDFFAQLFADRGCQCAVNLDGGSSASMVFMGEALTRHGGSKARDVQRTWSDALMWGYSENVPSVTDRVYHKGSV